MAKITIDEIRARLSTSGSAYRDGKILLDGEPIGGIVAYGSSKGRRRGNVSSKTVYGSRIYRPVTIEEEASRESGLLDKVARKVAAAMREGKWSVAAPQSGDTQ